MSKLYRALALVAVFAVVGSSTQSIAQWIGNDSGLCPNGRWVYQGTAAMCVPHAPQSRCPAGYQYCAEDNLCCHPGNYCSTYGCIERGSIECGGYSCPPGTACARLRRACMPQDAQECSDGTYCNAGNRCWREAGRLTCVTAAHAYGHEHAQKLRKWLAENKARLKGEIQERHKKGVEYINDDPQVKEAIRNLQILVAAYGYGGRGAAEAVDWMLAVKGAFDANSTFASDHYLGSLAAVKNVSSALLNVNPAIPPGSSEVLTLAGAATTAYTYGFFFGP
jgi:hypothetical protein